MVFTCDCGKRFRAREGTPAHGNACPSCGGTLRAVEPPPPPPNVDINILLEQKKALRDEMRTRDRQLRIAQTEIHRLKAENEKLQAELTRARGGLAPITVSQAPVIVDRSTDWRPLELPRERLDFTSTSSIDDLPYLADAPQLPSERLPLFTPEKV